MAKLRRAKLQAALLYLLSIDVLSIPWVQILFVFFFAGTYIS